MVLVYGYLADYSHYIKHTVLRAKGKRHIFAPVIMLTTSLPPQKHDAYPRAKQILLKNLFMVQWARQHQLISEHICYSGR